MDLLSLFSLRKDDEFPDPKTTTNSRYEEVIERLSDLRRMSAEEVMTPRAVVQAIDADLEIDRLPLWKAGHHKHLPVYRDNLDHILGWITQARVKDLVHSGYTGSLKHEVLPAVCVQTTMTLDQVFMKFVHTSAPLLVVLDATGVTAGVLFLRDLLEVFFGQDVHVEGDTLAGT